MIADGVTYIDIPDFEPYDTSPPLREAASALGSKAFSKTLQLVNCVVEYKRDTDGAHQAMMGIVSGLYQQRAFRNVRQFVFGISQNNASTLNVVVATWQGDNIEVYNVGSYSLAHPATAVQFYLVLREIKRLAKSDHDRLIACSDALAVDIIDFPPQKWWATKALPDIREQPSETQDEPHPTTGQGGQSGLFLDSLNCEQLDSREKVLRYLSSVSGIYDEDSSGDEDFDCPSTPPSNPYPSSTSLPKPGILPQTSANLAVSEL
ncbi:hypothetical protein RhiTH_009670 [Rhizoctonia solani]